MRVRGKAFPLFIFISLFFVSCQTTKLSFTQDYLDLDSFSYSTPSYNVYLTRLDLDSQGLQLICKLDCENFFTVDDFAKDSGASYAFNTTAFLKAEDGFELLGCTKFNNSMITNPVEGYSALGFYFNQSGKLRAKVIKNQTEVALESVPAAFGGYFTILEEGELLEYKKLKRSRMACGLDQEGRYLYVLAVTSKRILGRSGLSYEDCGALLKAFGCTWGIQFDGGHSVGFVSPEFGYVHAKKNRAVPAALGFYLK